MPVKVIYTARWRNWQYGDQSDLDMGQVINIDENAPNNQRLVDLGYINMNKINNPTILECMMCGAQFLTEHDRDAHGRKRHPRRARQLSVAAGGPTSPVDGQPSIMLDTEGDREEKEMMRDTPLYLEKTEASLKG